MTSPLSIGKRGSSQPPQRFTNASMTWSSNTIFSKPLERQECSETNARTEGLFQTEVKKAHMMRYEDRTGHWGVSEMHVSSNVLFSPRGLDLSKFFWS